MQTQDPKPWQWQLCTTEPEPWRAGYGILALCVALCFWYFSLVFRFTQGEALLSASMWLIVVVLWLVVQIAIGRAHQPERFVAVCSTILQAMFPTAATLTAVTLLPSLREAVFSIATSVTLVELVAIHTLRLAAWGTIRKHRQGQLPRYFYLFGSLPDFGFAIVAVLFTLILIIDVVRPSNGFLIGWSLLGATVFLGAALGMYFGVPGSALSWRWLRVKRGREAPTLLPFRWPMNLAPAFCGPAFWLAHALLIAKTVMP